MPANRSSSPLASWSLPTRGVIRTLPAHELAGTDLWDADNVLLHAGELRPRRGLVSILSANFSSGTPIGAALYLTSSNTPTIVVVTTVRGYAYDGSWHDITGNLLTGTRDQPVRTALMVTGTPATTYLVVANGKDSLKQWAGNTAAPWVEVAGSPPLFSDMVNAYDRIVGLIPPYEVRWGEQASLASWHASNSRQLADIEPSPVVAISSRANAGIIVYKRKSIWVGIPQGGSSAFAFAFQMRTARDGPAGPHARVTVDDYDYYMTANGRIGAFNGSNHQWVGDGVFPVIQGNLDLAYASRIVAWYSPRFQAVFFAYPRVGDAGLCKGLVVMNLPFPEHGIPQAAFFPGHLGQDVSAVTPFWVGGDPTERVGLVSATATKFYDDSGSSDDGVAIDGYWQLGLQPVKGLDTARIEYLDPFLQRGEGYGSLRLKPVTSYVLDTPGGTVDPVGVPIDLAQVPVEGYKGVDARARFIGARFEFTAATGTIRYSGMVAAGGIK